MRRTGRTAAAKTTPHVPPASPVVTPVSSASLSVAGWLRSLRLAAPPRWFAEILLDVIDTPPESAWNAATDSRFHLYLFHAEWSYFFCHGGQASWIRIDERPTVHGRDEHALAIWTPPLAEIGRFLGTLELKHGISFRRDLARVRTNIAGAEPTVRAWVAALQ